MKKQNVCNITLCNCLKNSWGGVKRFSLALLLSSFLISPSFANTTTPEINTDYLNELTGPKVTWETATESDSDIVLINGNYYKYTYNKPDDYTEINDHSSFESDKLDDLINIINTNDLKVIVKDIVSTYIVIVRSTHENLPFIDFVNNIVYDDNYYYHHGAIFNDMHKPNITITSNFIGNASSSANSSAGGAAIYNAGTIDNITGDFIGNYAHSEQAAIGGAIFNAGTIGDITGDFIGNYAHIGGAIFNVATIGDITGDFIGNYAHNEQAAGGGAIANEVGNITLTNSSFYNNYAKGMMALGGAILNMQGTLDITADNDESIFSGNYVETDIDGDGVFTKKSNAIHSIAGTINLNAGNNGTIRFDDGIILSDGSEMGSPMGAVASMNISGISDYIFGEKTTGVSQDDVSASIDFWKEKGAIVNIDDNQYTIINTDTNSGDPFYLTGIKQSDNTYTTYVSEILNSMSEDYINILLDALKNMGITPHKQDNGYVVSESGSLFGVFKNGDMYYVTSGDTHILKTDNSGKIIFNASIEVVSADGSLGSVTQTGANVYFGPDSTIKGYAYNISGGTLNDATVDDTGELHATNSAKINGLLANGGALIDLDAGTILTGDVKFAADATLQGNFDYNKIFNEIVAETGSLTLEGGINAALSQDSLVNTSENKSLVLSSGNFEVGSGVQEVSGWKELNITDNATVKLAGDIALAETQNKMNLLSGSTLDLAGNSPLIATIDGSVNNDGNMTFTHATDGADDVITIKGNYKAYKNAMITIDVDPVAAISDKLIIEGDVEGRTKVVINPLSNDLSTGKALFVEAMNDDLSTGAYFDVYRVVGDAHKWNTLYENNKWYAATEDIITNASGGYGDVDDDEELVLGGNNSGNNDNTVNITQPKPQVVSEAIAYMSLPRIGLEQTKDLMRVVSNKVTSTKIKSGRCGMGECNYDGQVVNGAWIDLGHKKSEIDAPVSVEAKINAVDLGFDIQKDLHNRLGIFASYRQGEYELSGDGENYYAKEGADIDIDSWILGLYHRYDYGRLWTMSSIYGGIQKVDMSTDDGVSSDTDGIQFGGSVEAGLVFEPQKRLTIEPSIRLGYNFIKYDDMSDSYGKTAEFDNVQNIETEAGVKVEKTWFVGKNNITKLYFKPSVIQNFGKGDVNITSLDTVEGLENETLIRGEIGGSFNFGNGWSGFGSLGYTYGSDYDATDFNIGINYNW